MRRGNVYLNPTKGAGQFKEKPLQYKDQLDEICTDIAADGAFAQNDSLFVDPAILAIDESTTPVTPGPSSAVPSAESAVEDAGMKDSLGIEDVTTELSS